MLGKLPRNEIIIKKHKNKGGGNGDATKRECWCREKMYLLHYCEAGAPAYYSDRDWISFWTRWESPDIGCARGTFFPVLLPTIIIDVHYENERLAGGQLEQSTISLCGTKSNRQGYAIHQVHSHRNQRKYYIIHARARLRSWFCIIVFVVCVYTMMELRTSGIWERTW